MTQELIRTARFAPYRKGMGPTFTLRLFDLNQRDSLGKWRLGYELRQHENGKTTILFAGDDFHCSPMHGVDSDATVASLMGFLTLRPGDTDADHFEHYTPEQTEFAEQHAEALSCEVDARYCDENDNPKS